jgi:hypothetical protein
MPSRRLVTTVLAGSALLSLAFATPASAKPAPGKPTAPGKPAAGSYGARCTGDTLWVHVPSRVPATARLLAGHDQGHLAATGDRVAVPASGSVSFDLAGLGARHYRVDVTDLKGESLGSSNAVPATSCAPGHEVPEVPAAALAPGSLLLTGAALLARRRRAAGAR